MRNPIENLGDYNRVREDLQKYNGNREALYKSIGDSAVYKKAPSLLIVGGIIGVSLCGLGQIGYSFVKKRRKIIREETILKEQFEKICLDEDAYTLDCIEEERDCEI